MGTDLQSGARGTPRVAAAPKARIAVAPEARVAVAPEARVAVAPMMDWTTSECRRFHRALSARTLLYTEMVTAPALVRGGARHLLRFAPEEHPVALQLGGADPAELAEAARMGAGEGYGEVNLNCGCPSDRVRSGAFGAVLMRDAPLVARCVEAMTAGGVPVSVKCRIGVDEQVPEEVLPDFVRHVTEAGATRVIVHARKAWLRGLSPKENREVPPLDHELVHSLRDRFPDLALWINGGIATVEEARGHLAAGMDGVMIGRAAYHAPWATLGPVDATLHGEPWREGPEAVARAMAERAARHVAGGGRLHAVTRHMLGLFAGRPGARRWRRHLSEHAHRPGAGPEVIGEALALVAGEPMRRAS